MLGMIVARSATEHGSYPVRSSKLREHAPGVLSWPGFGPGPAGSTAFDKAHRMVGWLQKPIADDETGYRAEGRLRDCWSLLSLMPVTSRLCRPTSSQLAREPWSKRLDGSGPPEIIKATFVDQNCRQLLHHPKIEGQDDPPNCV